MMKLRNMLIAAIAIVAFTSNVSAGQLSMGVVASVMEVDASGTETDTLTAGGADVADTSVRKKSVSETAMAASLYAEYTFVDSRWPVAFGVEYTPGSAVIGSEGRSDEHTAGAAGGGEISNSNRFKAAAEATNMGTLYVEMPLFGALYAKAGIATLDINHTGTQRYKNENLNGTTLGLGVKGETGTGLLWKASYEQTDYDTLSQTSTGSSVTGEENKIKADLDTKAYRISVGKNF